MSARRFPRTDAGPFPTPPTRFRDGHGRAIEIESIDMAGFEDVAAMYRSFDPSQRAQGIPPSDPERVEPWVKTILEDGVHVVARHGDDVVGHAMLVPDGGGAAELAIFVHQDYQRAGIGGELIDRLLGAGVDAGMTRIWLTVERWNAPAIALYRRVGFETVQADRFDLEMAVYLPEDADVATAEG